MPRVRLIGILVNIGHALLSLDRKADRIMTKLDDLQAANTAEASAVADALAAIKTLSEQHQTDLAELAAQHEAGVDVGPLVTSMRGRADSLNAAIAALHANVSAEAAPAATGTTEATAETAVVEPVADPAAPTT